jgi:hypothetical protein
MSKFDKINKKREKQGYKGIVSEPKEIEYDQIQQEFLEPYKKKKSKIKPFIVEYKPLESVKSMNHWLIKIYGSDWRKHSSYCHLKDAEQAVKDLNTNSKYGAQLFEYRLKGIKDENKN